MNKLLKRDALNREKLSSSNFPKKITEGSNTSRFALSANSPWYLLNQDILKSISKSLDKRDLKNFRLVCTSTCKVSNMTVTLNFQDLKTEASKMNDGKWNFIWGNNFKCILILDTLTIQLFYELLISKEKEKAITDFFQKSKTIESLEISAFSNNDQITTFKKILTKINEYPSLFPNLKNLITNQFSNFTNCSIPDSIESFKSINGNQINVGAQYNANTNVDIRNLKNLKSITLGLVLERNTFNLENLPSLESVKINCLYSNPRNRNLTIRLKEHPNLVSVVVNGIEEMRSKIIAEFINRPEGIHWRYGIPCDELEFSGTTRIFPFNQMMGFNY